jgi:succinyl-CoA synthetase beta subunit
VYVHEYQAKAVLALRGVEVPAGRAASSPGGAAAAFDELHAPRALIKAQIHAGGRGKAGGILAASSRRQAEDAARRLLGSTLVTAQTGPRGRPVSKVLVEEALDIQAEYYLAVTLDRDAGCPILAAAAEGGMDIETIGRARPEAIITERGNPWTGLEPFQARKVVAALGLGHDLLAPMTAVMLALGRTFIELDCSLIELNPLARLPDGRLVAADVKMTFDDSALGRHSGLADLRDPSQEEEREVEAARHDLSYVGLDGRVGCMVNGAGLAMATMDLLRLHGAEPANFLDVGGAATAEKVAAAFRILAADPGVRAILVNIFGGIVQCDLVAEGILEAVRRAKPAVPLIVRLEGNRAAEGRRALAASGLRLTAAETLDGAARSAAEAAR